MTIAEVLVVGGVSALVMGLLVQALVLAFRAQARTVEHTQGYREALLVAERLERELDTCNSLTSPLPLMNGVTTPLPSNPMRFRRNDQSVTLNLNTGVWLTYYYDPTRRELIRDDSRNNRPRAVVHGVQSFTVDAQTRKVDVLLQVDYAPDPIRFSSTPCRL